MHFRKILDLINFTRQTKCKNRETKTGRNRINQSNGERERERETYLKKREKRGQSCNMWYGESEETKKKTDVAYFVQRLGAAYSKGWSKYTFSTFFELKS